MDWKLQAVLKVLNIHRKTPMLESLFNKVQGWRTATLLNRDSNTGVFLWIFLFTNSYRIRYVFPSVLRFLVKMITTPIKTRVSQFITFKPLSYCFKETAGFDVKASFARRLWLFKCSKTIRKIIIFFKKKICIIFTKSLFFSVNFFFFQIKLFI